MNGLPTAEEYKKLISIHENNIMEWSQPMYKCPKCGGGMCKNLMVVLTSIPAQYEYKCDNCGNVEYQYG